MISKTQMCVFHETDLEWQQSQHLVYCFLKALDNYYKNNVKDKLIKRNKKLLQMLDAKNISNKEVEELRLAINKDYVELFWIGHQG